MDSVIADMLITHGLNLFRLAAGARSKIMRILEQAEKDLSYRILSDKRLSENSQARTKALLDESRTILVDAYSRGRDTMREKLEGLTTAEVRAVRQAFETAGRSVNVTLTPRLPTMTTLQTLAKNTLIEGAASADWWARHGGDTAFRFAAEVRRGLAIEESTAQIVNRIAGTKDKPGVMDISKKSARTLVNQSIAAVSNAARMQTFQENAGDLIGIRQLSTLDGRTTDICIAYSGGEWDMNYEPINGTELPYNGGVPRHWNCRSVMVPIVAPLVLPNGKVVKWPDSTRASVDGQVSNKLTFAEWLSTKDEAFQDELLGKGRAKLFRDGTITLQQLLDQSGNPLTLKQLLAKYGS